MGKFTLDPFTCPCMGFDKMKQTQFIDFPDMGVTVKISWCGNREVYEVVCGTTYIGSDETVDGAKQVARDWFAELMAR